MTSLVAPGRPEQVLVADSTGVFLHIEIGLRAGTVLALSADGVYVLGRARGADITIEDSKVSRRHAEIGLFGPGAYVLADLDSTNGTRINGTPVRKKAALQHGDLITLGDTTLRFVVQEGSNPPSPRFAATLI